MGTEEDVKKLEENVQRLAQQIQNMPAQFVQAMTEKEEQQKAAQEERNQQQQLKNVQDTLSNLQGRLQEVSERTKGLDELKRAVGDTEASLAERMRKVEELTGKYCSEDPNNPICQLAIKSIKEEREKEAQQPEGEGEEEEHGAAHSSAAEFLACEECGPFFVDAATKSIDFVRKVLDKLPSEQKAKVIAQRCTGEGCEVLLKDLEEKEGIRVERKKSGVLR